MAAKLTQHDIDSLTARGMSVETVEEQLRRFETGFPYLKLAGSVTVGRGIQRLDAQAEDKAIARWKQYLADGGSVAKFVPASGAASRMFKALFAFVNGSDDTPAAGSPVSEIIDRLPDLPFIAELDAVLTRATGKTAAQLRDEKRYREIIAAIVTADGMNYGGLPKGLLTFHRYGGNATRTPLEEQMAEGARTAAANGSVNLHFTVSPDHRALFEAKIAAACPALEKQYGVKFNVTMSEQKPSTDTIAVTPDNNIFRTDDGNPVFRPGGHGALIANLGDMDAALVFVKNIDNVVPDSQRDDTIKYKQILGGELVLVHDAVEGYLRRLANGATRAEMDDMLQFLETKLCTVSEGARQLDDAALAAYLRGKFDRPLRVCGMVVNEGEPGGGPYLAYNKDGSYSPQILESTQIDTANAESARMMSTATHFNPVDLVCYLHDVDGNRYDLSRYVDPDTGFISSKSLGGRDLRALELPGLWNGAMSDWSTVFVEVPATTFNPVKTVNDLLRPVHQVH